LYLAYDRIVVERCTLPNCRAVSRSDAKAVEGRYSRRCIFRPGVGGTAGLKTGGRDIRRRTTLLVILGARGVMDYWALLLGRAEGEINSA